MTEIYHSLKIKLRDYFFIEDVVNTRNKKRNEE